MQGFALSVHGTALSGGRGRVLGALVGALLMGSLNNGMSLMNVPPFYQDTAGGSCSCLPSPSITLAVAAIERPSIAGAQWSIGCNSRNGCRPLLTVDKNRQPALFSSRQANPPAHF